MSNEKNYNVSKDPSDFINISDVVPDVILEIRYYSTYNFIGDRIDGYDQPIALLTKEAAAALIRASNEAISNGYRLKIYDAYRPQRAVNHFVRWAEVINDTRMK
nr:peptidase M15 [Lachnospiraceae bacterium]